MRSSSNAPTEFYFLTLFPKQIQETLETSLLARARQQGLIRTEVIQIRDFAIDKHHTVDDSPYGGGEGMLMKADVLYNAWKSVVQESSESFLTIYLSPKGKTLNSSLAKEFSTKKKIIFVCGHYEGIDQRFIDECVDQEVSIGDYVLTGGELPALVLTDAISRWIPGVVGNEDSVRSDSFENGRLKYPQYTRPRVFKNMEVPEVLMSGDHAKIRDWREKNSVSIGKK